MVTEVVGHRWRDSRQKIRHTSGLIHAVEVRVRSGQRSGAARDCSIAQDAADMRLVDQRQQKSLGSDGHVAIHCCSELPSAEAGDVSLGEAFQIQ